MTSYSASPIVGIKILHWRLFSWEGKWCGKM